MKLTNDFHETLIHHLKDPEQAAIYLEMTLAEGDFEMFLMAVRNIAEAQGGLSKISRMTNLNRANLYKMLSKKGRPEVQNIHKVLDALGFKISIVVKEKTKFRLKKAA